jgi:hypothetical protein
MKTRSAVSALACSSSFPFLLPIPIESDYIMRFFLLSSPAYGHPMLFGFGYIYGFYNKENSPIAASFLYCSFSFPSI